MNKEQNLKSIPAVDKILNYAEIKELHNLYSREQIVESVRYVINEIRNKILDSEIIDISEEDILKNIEINLYENSLLSLKPVVNATGVIIHTNLGRLPLCEDAIKNIVNISRSYSNLEVDLESGERSKRQLHIRDILNKLTGCESNLVVNNNAAAVMLAVNTFAIDREVIISRGELIEIGGSFRLPDIIEQSGARLVEVGTTNRTRPEDYENAINDNTALILKCHTSNYKIMGYTESVDINDLAVIGKKHNVIVVEDLGSGLLVDLRKYNLPYEPLISQSVEAGADIVTFSGDKLLGATQAGILLGKKKLIDRLEKNPLLRAIRVDKLCLAALESTLRLYFNFNKLEKELPLINFLTVSEDELKGRADDLGCKIEKLLQEDAQVQVKEEFSQIGGGSLPLTELKTFAVYIKFHKLSAKEASSRLRKCKTPIISRIKDDFVVMDLRTCFESDEQKIVEAIKEIKNMVRK